MVAIKDWGTPLVFVNIPYFKKDTQPKKHELYRPIEAAIKAALLFVGIRPLLGREFKALEPRLERLSGFMDRCVGGISDISANDQLNMPLELGLLICKLGEPRNWVLEGVRTLIAGRCRDLRGVSRQEWVHTTQVAVLGGTNGIRRENIITRRIRSGAHRSASASHQKATTGPTFQRYGFYEVQRWC